MAFEGLVGSAWTFIRTCHYKGGHHIRPRKGTKQSMHSLLGLHEGIYFLVLRA